MVRKRYEELLKLAHDEKIPLSPVYYRCAELRKEKGLAYNHGTTLRSHFPFGDESYGHMIYAKAERMVSLIKKKSDGDDSTESLLDTIYDLIAFATFYAEYLNDDNISLPGDDGNG